MDAFVTVVKSSKGRGASEKVAAGSTRSGLQPNASQTKGKGKKIEILPSPIKSEESRSTPTASSPSTSRAIAARQTKQLLKSLNDVSNPITHENGKGFDYVSSCCTGHERREGGREASYFHARNRKLGEQERENGLDGKSIMQGVRAYLGFCETDHELQRMIALAGGSTTYNQSSATHIVTSQWLSGSKTQKHLTTRSKNKVHVVSPEWVLDSIEKKKRQSEWRYSKVESGVQKSVAGFLKAGGSKSS